MKVVYSNGKKGKLKDSEAQNLYVIGRRTKEDWEDLKLTMESLGIIKFEDPFLGPLGGDMIAIEYVVNQIGAH